MKTALHSTDRTFASVKAWNRPPGQLCAKSLYGGLKIFLRWMAFWSRWNSKAIILIAHITPWINHFVHAVKTLRKAAYATERNLLDESGLSYLMFLCSGLGHLVWSCGKYVVQTYLAYLVISLVRVLVGWVAFATHFTLRCFHYSRQLFTPWIISSVSGCLHVPDQISHVAFINITSSAFSTLTVTGVAWGG